MVTRTAILMLILLTTWPVAQAVANTAVDPVARARDSQWMMRHETVNVALRDSNPRLVFVGDSITQQWETAGWDVWEKEYKPYGAVNMGMGGDKTQHALWRVQHSTLGDASPDLVVIQIGTNNILSRRPLDKRGTAEKIAEGIVAVVDAVRARLPDTRILVLGLFPRPDLGPKRARLVDQINAILAGFSFDSRTTYKDIGAVFLAPDGSPADGVTFDLVHLTPEGFRRWADAIRPEIEEALSR